MKIINKHKKTSFMNLHLHSILLVGLCSIPLFPASSFAGGPDGASSASESSEDSDSESEISENGQDYISVSDMAALLEKNSDGDQISLPPAYTSKATLPQMMPSASSSTVYSPFIEEHQEETDASCSTQKLSLAVAEKIREIEIAAAIHNSNPSHIVVPYADAEKNALKELLDQLHVNITQLITHKCSSYKSFSIQYLKNLVAASQAVLREETLSTPVSAAHETSKQYFSTSQKQTLQFLSVAQFHHEGMKAVKNNPQQYLEWVSYRIKQIPIMGPLEYAHWLSLVPKQIQIELDSILESKIVGSFSIYSHEQILDILNQIPLSLVRKYWNSRQNIMTPMEWIQWVQDRTVTNIQGIRLFQEVDELFHLGINYEYDALWIIATLQEQKTLLIVEQLEILIDRMAAVLTSQNLNEVMDTLDTMYSHDSTIQQKIKSLQGKHKEHSQTANRVIRNSFQEELRTINLIHSAEEKMDLIKKLFTKGETLKYLESEFTMQHLLQILYTIPTETVYSENADVLVSLRNKIRNYTGNAKWTASDLYHMHVSKNLALVSSIMTRIPANATAVERQQVLSVVKTFFAQSGVHDIHHNPDKSHMKSILDRQISRHTLEQFFQINN